MVNKPITQANIAEAIEENVSWNWGVDSAWESDALIGSLFLLSLSSLAARAPTSEKRKFLKQWKT